jgi:hypothetical protein
MYERWVRLFIVVAVVATLFLPMTPQGELPHWEWLYLVSAEELSYGLGGLFVLWAVWAGPLLAPFNFALAFCRPRALRILYWIYLLAAIGISLFLLIARTAFGERLGYVVVSCLIYLAALLEIVSLVLGRLRKAKRRGL